MALLAVQGMAMSAAAASLPSHHHGAVSSSVSTSSYALTAAAAFPRARATLAVGAVTSAAVTPVLDVYCGRGDKKTKRGKRFNHSYGNVSPATRRRELAHNAFLPLQHPLGRISSMMGRSFRLR
ncbi:hypothetical protein PVAP13_7KG104809 [Panicum virgatum]|uniref:Uncharacterized protein n=1 Tax=Panicum virgatum TaxID=38727 RepID=A0A8T0Q8Q5_PANVG|nr:hypothetical protein PVAP13_7KG104809 [Panicum virgatum]